MTEPLRVRIESETIDPTAELAARYRAIAAYLGRDAYAEVDAFNVCVYPDVDEPPLKLGRELAERLLVLPPGTLADLLTALLELQSRAFALGDAAGYRRAGDTLQDLLGVTTLCETLLELKAGRG